MRWLLLLVGLEFPAIVAFLDCVNRDAEEFTGGAEDRGSWIKWLLVATLTCPIGVGYGILLGYYWSVVKRAGTTWR